MTRPIAHLCVLAMFTAALLLGGCGATPVFDTKTLDSAEARAGAIAERVGAASTGVTDDAGAIIADATDGLAATPPSALSTLKEFWTRIIARAQSLMRRGEDLKTIRADIDVLKSEVSEGKRQLAAEKKGRADDNAAWQKKLDKANSRWESMFRTLSWLAIIGIGIAVAVGFMTRNFRISIAGAAGGFAIIIACMILGQVQKWLPWFAGGLAGITVLWIVIESYLRGSFKAAIKTNPIQDVIDLFSGGGQNTETDNAGGAANPPRVVADVIDPAESPGIGPKS